MDLEVHRYIMQGGSSKALQRPKERDLGKQKMRLIPQSCHRGWLWKAGWHCDPGETAAHSTNMH